MTTIILAKVRRTPESRSANPTGLAVTKQLGCACFPLAKARRRRKKIGSPEYLAWLDDNVPPFKRAVRKFMKQAASDISEFLLDHLNIGKIAKISQADVERAIKSIDFSKWSTLIGIVEKELVEAFKDNAKAGFAAISFDPSDDILALVNDRAVAWASKHAAMLVGMRKDENGNWVETTTPNAITDTTRDELRALVSDAIDEGWGPGQFADEIKDAFAFSDVRSEMIARTELAFAHVEGNLEAWRESGIVEKKESILGSEHDIDDVCNDNADAGPIGIDDEFPSGDQGPPYHPNCVCDVVPVLVDT